MYETSQPFWHKILRWAALALGLALWGGGVAAMYGDDYKVAVVLYFFGIGLIAADFLSLEENRKLRGLKKAALVIISVLVATIFFALSIAWIQLRISDVLEAANGRRENREIPWPITLWYVMPLPQKRFIPTFDNWAAKQHFETKKAEAKPQRDGAKDTAKTTKPESQSSSTELKAGHPPIFTFHDKSPDFFTLLMGNATINLAKGMLTQKGGWHGFANIDGYEPLTIYVKDDTLHIDAFVQDSSGQVTFKIENGGEDVTVLPPRWDRNFTNNELEIVDEKEVPVFQMVVHRPSVIELSAIFYGTRGSVFSARPKSKLFKYPSWEHSGERASQ